MKEIKFRVWDKENKCWLVYKEMTIGWTAPLSGDSKAVKRKEFALPDNSACSDLQHCLDNSDAFSVMQYTEHKDKNGKEIYESDIIKTERGFVNVIMWGEVTHTLKHFPKNIAECTFWGWMALNISQGMMYSIDDALGGEIIGNLFENPELLKKYGGKL